MILFFSFNKFEERREIYFSGGCKEATTRKLRSSVRILRIVDGENIKLPISETSQYGAYIRKIKLNFKNELKKSL